MSKKKRDIPEYKLPIIETHFHLDMLKERSEAEILALASKYMIEKMVTIAVAPYNFDTVIEIAKRNDNIFCTQGIHPHSAKEWNQNAHTHLTRNLKEKKANKIVAVGEIGLDYYYLKSEKKEQLDAFEAQLQLAVDFDLPVIVHSRDADDDTITVLNNFKNKLKQKLVIHSFTSGLPLAQFAIDHGYYLGFNGILTFKNAHNVHDALKLTPLDHVLLETDAPFLTPEPYRGGENAPHFIPFIAERIAELKNISVENVITTIYKNTHNFFNWS